MLSLLSPTSTDRGLSIECAEPPGSRVVYTVSLTDFSGEADKLKDLYGWVMESRREAGDAVVPFHTFVDLVRDRVSQLRSGGNTEVVCRAAVKDGRVSLSVRGARDT